MNEDFGLMTEQEQKFVESYSQKIRKEELDRIRRVLTSDEAFDIIYSYGDGGAEDVMAGLINLITRKETA